MLIVYRVLWIVGLIALVVVLALIVNPRAQAPQHRSQWGIVQEGRFTIRAPKQSRWYAKHTPLRRLPLHRCSL